MNEKDRLKDELKQLRKKINDLERNARLSKETEENGKLAGVSGSSQDITSQKNAEDKLNAQNQQLAANEQQLRAANQQLQANEQQLRAANQQLQANEQQLRAANQQLQANEQQLRAANQQLQANEQQLRAANQQLQANEQQLRAANQQLQANEQQLIVTNQQLLEAKEKAENSEKYLENIIKKIADPIFVKDEESKLLVINDAFCQLFGMRKENVMGKDLAEDVSPAERESFLKIDKMVLNDGIENINEESLTVQGGQTKTISTKKSRFIDAQGRKFLVGIIRDVTERKQYELELLKAKEKAEESELKFRTLFEESKDAILISNLDATIIDVNKEALRLLGFTRDELLKKQIFDLHPKEELERLQDLFHTSKKSEDGQVFFESKYATKKGAIIDVEINSKIFDTENGLVQGIVRDITERKKAEEALKESEERLQLTMKATSDGLFDLNIKTNEIYFSPAYFTMLGYDPDEFPQTMETYWSLLHPEDRKRSEVNLSKFLSGEIKDNSSEMRFKTKSGEWNWILSRGEVVERDAEGNPVRFVGTNTNINNQKNAELELQKAKEKAEENEEKANKNAEMVLSSQAVANICSYSTNLKEDDLEKSVWECSPEFYKIFGIDETYPHTIAGWAAFIHPDHREKLVAYHEYVVRNRTSFNHEYKIIRINDGVERWVRGTGELVYDKKGKPVRMFGAIQDITELKKTEAELIKAKEKAEESDRLKSAFLANMSHEIRTPMNGILGFSNQLKKPNLTGEQQQRYIGIIEKSGARMLNIINDIIDISKIETGLMKPEITESDINEQIEYIYTFFKPEVEAKGMKLSFTNTLPSKEAIIQTDREKIFAILTNLVKNAIKYTNKGSIEFGYNKKGDFIEFFVEDTGIGIPKDRQEAIFERFIQADIDDVQARQGAGLGLAISKAYVEMLGGKIWAVSEEGKGSVFYFTIPYLKTIKKETFHNTFNVGDDGPKLDLKILIVEDDETSNELLSIIVEKYGKEIISVENGKKALEACRKNPDIDLILMDIQLPGMNGYEVTRQIREFNKEVIIIAQTAYGLSTDREKAINAGCNDYISKPIQKEKFDALMQAYLMKK